MAVCFWRHASDVVVCIRALHNVGGVGAVRVRDWFMRNTRSGGDAIERSVRLSVGLSVGQVCKGATASSL